MSKKERIFGSGWIQPMEGGKSIPLRELINDEFVETPEYKEYEEEMKHEELLKNHICFNNLKHLGFGITTSANYYKCKVCGLIIVGA